MTSKIINPGLAALLTAIVNICVLGNNISICLDEIILVRFEVYIVSHPSIFENLVCDRLTKLKDCLK